MIADILNYKGLRGWSCGDSYATLTWDDAEAGRAKPSEEEIAAWDLEYEADKVAQSQTQQSDAQAAADAKADAVTQYLVSHTPLEIYQYVRTQVNAHNATNLAELKTAVVELQNLVGKLAAAVGADIRGRMR